MDVPLGFDVYICYDCFSRVLILVIVDVPLGLARVSSLGHSILSLNPCYSGCASRLEASQDQVDAVTAVLILVIVDVPLG